MTELKTLKDIEETLVDMEGVGLTIAKQEAIKWIKELSKHEKVNGIDFVVDRFIGHETISMVTWIKHFFNITEEDLK